MAVEFDAYQVTTAGTYAAATTTSAVIALPQCAAKVNPKFVRVCTDAGSIYVTFGASSAGLTATSTSIMVSVSDSQFLNVMGQSQWAAIRTVSGTANVNIVPIEGG